MFGSGQFLEVSIQGDIEDQVEAEETYRRHPHQQGTKHIKNGRIFQACKLI